MEPQIIQFLALLNGNPMVLVQPTNLLELCFCAKTQWNPPVPVAQSEGPQGGSTRMALGTLYHFKLRIWPRFSRKPSISVKVKVLSLPLSHSIKVNGGNKNVKVVQYLLQE